MADDGYAAGRAPVFVSHAGSDTGWAEWVAWQLKAEGHPVELDTWDWQVGEDFVTRMRAVLERPGVVVVTLWSADYFEPGRWTQEEWNAMRAASRKGAGRLVPLRVEPVTPPIFEATLIWDDLFDVDPVTARARLLAAVNGKPTPVREPVYPGAEDSTPGVMAVDGPRLPGLLPTVWRAPPRNSAFTGRDGVLARLRESLSSGGRVVVWAMNGIGGVGKTSLVTEYVHRFAADFSAAWWVDAEEPTLIGAQFRELAVAARVVSADADVQTGVTAARAWLRQQPGWVVVFDNAENPGPIREWLPEGAGQVLVTSRDPRWIRIVDVAEVVDVFIRTESVALLRRHLTALTDVDAGRIAERLGDLPLAVAQAAEFMAECGISASDYLTELRAHPIELLTEGVPATYPRSFATAVAVTLDRIAAEAAAIQLMTIAAYLGPEPIPLHWFTTAKVAAVLPTPLAAAGTSPLAVRRVVAHLVRLGLIRLSTGGNPIVHRLTAIIVRGWLQEHHELGSVQHQAEPAGRMLAEAVLLAAQPGGITSPRTWQAWAELTPHLLALDPANADNPDLRWLATEATWVLLVRGDIRSGYELATRLHRAWRGRFGPDHPDTLTVAAALGRAYRDSGDCRAARDLDQDTLDRRGRVQGVDHPETLDSATRLAIDLRRLGDVTAARDLNRDTLARYRRVLGADHRNTLISATNLAIDLRRLGDVAGAHALDRETLERRRRVLGHDYPETLISANNLAIDLHRLGDVAAARDLNQDTLSQRRRVLGDDHPDTLASANNLAIDLHRLGDVAAARDLNQDTLDRYRRVLGDDHPDTLASANNLAIARNRAGDVAADHDPGPGTLDRRQSFLGEHPGTLRSERSLAEDLKFSQGAYPSRATYGPGQQPASC
jgi:hypothetical protein